MSRPRIVGGTAKGRALEVRPAVRRRLVSQPAVELDTGGPDPWLHAAPDDPDYADRLLEWHDWGLHAA